MRCRYVVRSTNTVSNHPIEHDVVKWSEQLPIDETWHPTGTKGCNLLEAAFVDAITQPCISGEPTFAAQHELRLINLGNSPPVDQRAGDQRIARLWSKSFPFDSS